MDFKLPAILNNSGSSSQDSNRKRKGDWSHSSDFNDHINDTGPSAKISNQIKDRRKSQGEFVNN